MEIDLSDIVYNGFGNFKFYSIDSKNFIKNDLITIECGYIVQNYFDNEKYFNVYFYPNGNILKLSYRFFDIFFYDELISKINNIDLIILFLENFKKSFFSNTWYSDGYLFRLIGKTNLALNQMIHISNYFNLFNAIQIIRLSQEGYIPFSPQQFISSIPFRLSETSKSIINVEEICCLIITKNYTLNSLVEYFEISNEYIDTLYEIELNYFTKINYFDYTFYSQNWKMIIDKWKKVDYQAAEIQQFFDMKFREEENIKRYELGYNSVGSLFNETRLYNLVKSEFPNYTVISQFSPIWLKPQRFDIFIKELNIAIEYNGIQHYEAIDYFGGLDGLKNTQFLDKKKRQKSKTQNVKVIDIKYDMDMMSSLILIKEEIIKIEKILSR